MSYPRAIACAYLAACVLYVLLPVPSFAAALSCERLAVDGVRAEISALIAGETTPATVRKKLEEVVKHLSRFAAEMEKTPTDRIDAVHAIESAISDLEGAFKSALIGSAEQGRWTSALLDAAEGIVSKSIGAAESDPAHDTSALAKAREIQSEARALRSSGDLKKSAAKLKDALTKAESASRARPFDQPCGPTIAMESPSEGSIIASSVILVKGTATGTRDIGIVVNDYIAEVDVSQAGTADDPFRWSAAVEVTSGVVPLRATVTNASGQSNDVTRTVTVSSSQRAVALRPYPVGGVTPLGVTFSVSADDTDQVTRYELDLDSDGSYELSSATPFETPSFVYATPGVRAPSLRVTYSDGTSTTSTAVVNAQTFAMLNGVLKQTWSRFVDTLASGDVDAALLQLADDGARAKYSDILRLIQPTLPQFAEGLGTILPVRIDGAVGHYLLTREEEGVLNGYHLYVVRDAKGVWRIAQF